MNLVWSNNCVPNVVNADRDNSYTECCSARFTFTLIGLVTPGTFGDYFPNRCLGVPSTPTVTIGPMVVDMEIVSDGIVVDDQLLVNGSAFQAGQHPVILGEGTTATGANFPGGLSLCNGQHSIPAGTVIATVQQGATVTLAGGDNHGINLFVAGNSARTAPAAIILRPVQAP